VRSIDYAVHLRVIQLKDGFLSAIVKPEFLSHDGDTAIALMKPIGSSFNVCVIARYTPLRVLTSRGLTARQFHKALGRLFVGVKKSPNFESPFGDGIERN
jgi:hypothetical protein